MKFSGPYIPPRGQPIFGEVIQEIRGLGGDRAALVLEATPSTEARIMVIMLSIPAVRALGPLCVAAAAKLVTGNEPKVLEMFVEDKTSIHEIFTLMASRKRSWCWSGNTEKPPLCSYFLSQEICEWLAPRLTAAGCPCSLK